MPAWEWIPVLTGAGAIAAILRQALFLPWMEARRQQKEAERERIQWIAAELAALRGDVRRLSQDLMTLHKEVTRFVPSGRK